MDAQNREPESNQQGSNNQPEHVDNLIQLNEVRPGKRNQTSMAKEKQLQLPPPDQNVTDFTINQATPTLLTDVETAAELSPSLNTRPRENRTKHYDDKDSRIEAGQNEQAERVGGRGLAVAGLIASIISLFVYPIFMGLVGIVLGFIGMRSGNRTLSFWAIGIGAVSILVAILFTPFVAR